MLTLHISDMTCGRCAGTIARAVADVDKEARIEVDLSRKRVTVTARVPDSEVMEAIQEAGYTPERAAAAPDRRPRSGPGCGCGCGPRTAPAAEAAPSTAPEAGSCCR